MNPCWIQPQTLSYSGCPEPHASHSHPGSRTCRMCMASLCRDPSSSQPCPQYHLRTHYRECVGIGKEKRAPSVTFLMILPQGRMSKCVMRERLEWQDGQFVPVSRFARSIVAGRRSLAIQGNYCPGKGLGTAGVPSMRRRAAEPHVRLAAPAQRPVLSRVLTGRRMEESRPGEDGSVGSPPQARGPDACCLGKF